jgi:hypothetical protein
VFNLRVEVKIGVEFGVSALGSAGPAFLRLVGPKELIVPMIIVAKAPRGGG